MLSLTSQPGLILASASPRRRQLLEGAGIAVQVDAACLDETPVAGESPREHVLRLAAAKAEAVSRRHPGCVVLGADTAVVADGEIFGKPADVAESCRMLLRLSGRWHDVLTGVALVRQEPPARRVWVCTTRVRFRDLSPAAVREYCRQVHTLDKAGGYGIQEHGDLLVAEVDGLVSTVIGLPVEEVLPALAGLGCRTTGEPPDAGTGKG